MEQADPDWAPPVHTISGFSGMGLPELWAAIALHQKKTTDSGSRAGRRAGQRVRWLEALIQDGLAQGFAAHPSVAGRIAEVRRAVAEAKIPASTAADELLALFFGRT
jgi:LAO/AO transport system kinase